MLYVLEAKIYALKSMHQHCKCHYLPALIRQPLRLASSLGLMVAEMKVQPHHADATAEEAAIRR